MSAAEQRQRHAPRLGRLGRLLGPFQVTGVFWYRVHLFGVRNCHRWVVATLVPLLTTCFFFVLFSIRGAIAANLTPVLGRCGFLERQRRIFRTLLSFAWCLTERYEHYSGVRQCELIRKGARHWDDLIASQQGFILITAHVGAWDSGTMLPAPEAGRRVHVVREEEIDPKAQELMEEIIRKQGGELCMTHFAATDPLLGVQLLEALRRGEIVALQGDRPPAGGQTVTVSLFGRPFPVPVGPIMLARLAGVPLLPVFILREGRLLYRVIFREPIRVECSQDRAQDVQHAADRLATSVEWAIREEPHQWFCFSRVWSGDATAGS